MTKPDDADALMDQAQPYTLTELSSGLEAVSNRLDETEDHFGGALDKVSKAVLELREQLAPLLKKETERDNEPRPWLAPATPWRKEQAADVQLAGLSNKVERRINSTRGMFISTAGFRDEAVALYRMAKESRLILMDGQDLALILDGRIELPDALRAKVTAAALRGEPFQKLADI